MPELPPGWRVSNSAGEFSGHPREEDIDSAESESNESGNIGGLDVRPDSPGWDDVEEDSEVVNIKCLLCSENFASAKSMLDHCKIMHSLDFLAVRQQHNLDFYSTMKLINYIRATTKSGRSTPAINDPKLWAGDEFLQPTLEDDALLFSLDELIDFGQSQDVEPVEFEQRQATLLEQQHTGLGPIGEE